ncbi:FecR domain-containing protein [Herbaspirillum sp. LeCh32-8]|uniref:FecR domain-containing protein n=1 Tax=Herbaspirillum sp. LeCh32-8 TaxID=2821356 RepID=UPI001AE36FBB|nr:FecR domain-containing protein [Herbaspirillum sp. LeCh32-8]MBP0600860.1 FecR domain-containing protein [Herbaspirillum sp. LeCh32-8]
MRPDSLATVDAVPATAPAAPTPLDPDIVRQAANWMARLWADDATPEDAAACSQWRNQRYEHELAWQRMQALGQKFTSLPDPAGRQALKAAPEKLRLMRRKTLKALGLMLLTGGAAELGRRSEAWQGLAADYASGVGEIRDVMLPDGTRLVLNTNSAVDIVYTDTARRIKLRFGEIMISTAPDSATPHRPFTVAGRDGEVLALGTRFVVRQREDSSSVAVMQGAVEVRPRRAGAVLRVDAGYQADFAADAAADTAERIEEGVGNWSQGLLLAEQMPLSDFIAELGRYRHGVLRCAPDVAGLKVSGVFSLRDTDRALSNLTLGLPVQLSYRTRYWVSVISRPGQK